MYDAASTIMAQKLAQVRGVGQVMVGGGSLPAVRVELNPSMLNKYGIGLEQVRSGDRGAPTPTRRRGRLSDGNQRWEIGANDQLLQADRLRAADRRVPQRRAGPASATSAPP